MSDFRLTSKNSWKLRPKQLTSLRANVGVTGFYFFQSNIELELGSMVIDHCTVTWCAEKLVWRGKKKSPIPLSNGLKGKPKNKLQVNGDFKMDRFRWVYLR